MGITSGPDGRRLAWEIYGNKSGRPVFLLHGSPASRLGPRPSERTLRDEDICLITFDRSGYGRSDPDPGRTIAKVAGDVKAIADSLGLHRFSVVGRSGGGPHALACAAL